MNTLPKLHRLVNIPVLRTSNNFKLPNRNSNAIIRTSSKATSNLNIIAVNVIYRIIDNNFLLDSEEFVAETQYENERITNNGKSCDQNINRDYRRTKLKFE